MILSNSPFYRILKRLLSHLNTTVGLAAIPRSCWLHHTPALSPDLSTHAAITFPQGKNYNIFYQSA